MSIIRSMHTLTFSVPAHCERSGWAFCFASLIQLIYTNMKAQEIGDMFEEVVEHIDEYEYSYCHINRGGA